MSRRKPVPGFTPLSSVKEYLESFPDEVLYKWLTDAHRDHVKRTLKRDKGPSKETRANRALKGMDLQELKRKLQRIRKDC